MFDFPFSVPVRLRNRTISVNLGSVRSALKQSPINAAPTGLGFFGRMLL